MAPSPMDQPADPAAAPSPPGGYRVVARRYRPQRFDELVGQEHVARGLSGAIESGRIGHAYLFTGARGVGKTSAARIYAKALECAKGPAAEPCNACETCAAISAGQDVDVVEVDAASNRGIDEIRQLRQNVAVRPARGRYKIYIIDEVHMLTREAFNALLKTLEEPPAHVKFVLCTTEPEKLPITILSRCQRFDFTTVDTPAIARRLAQIVEAEGAGATAEALDLIARRAAGSMRDSQSLLEQLLGVAGGRGAAGGPIGVDDVHAVIGTGREERVGRLLAAIAGRDARAAIAALDAALAGGADPGGVLEQLIAALRDSLLASVGCGPEAMLQGPGLGVDLAALGRDVGTETLLAMLQIVDHALARMRTSGHAAVLAEMAVVRLARLENLESLSAAVERVSASTAALPAPGPREKKTTQLKPQPSDGVERPTRQDDHPRGVSDGAPIVAAAPEAAHPEAAARPAAEAAVSAPNKTGSPSHSMKPAEAMQPAAPPASLPDPLEAWRACGESVGGLAADFAATAIEAAWQEDLLEVMLPPDGSTAASFLRRPEVSAGLKKALADLAGRPVRHSIIVQSPAPASDNGPAADRPAAVGHGPQAFSQAALLREAMEHPLVVHARTVFDAAVRKVEPPRRERLPVQPAAAGSTHDRSDGPEEGAAGDGHGPDGDEGEGDHQHAGTDQGGLHG